MDVVERPSERSRLTQLPEHGDAGASVGAGRIRVDAGEEGRGGSQIRFGPDQVKEFQARDPCGRARGRGAREESFPAPADDFLTLDRSVSGRGAGETTQSMRHLRYSRK